MRYELLPTDELDTAALEKIKDGALEMVAPLQYSDANARRVMYSQFLPAVPLSTFLKKPLSKGEALTIVKNLTTGIDIGKFNIPVSYIVKDMDYLYIDEQSLVLYLLVLPIKGQPVEVSDIPDFLREVVSHMKFRDEDKDNYVARVLTKINSDSFALNDIKLRSE